MKEKDKAYELIASYRYTLSLPNAPLGDDKDRIAKQCALICVDEIIGALQDSNNYWKRVKAEIEAL